MTQQLERFDIRSIKSRATTPRLKPITLVSADSHVMCPPAEYLDYMDPKIRDAHGQEYLAFMATSHSIMPEAFGYPFTDEEQDLIDTRGALRGGGEIGAVDPERRLREVEAEGVVAEILHPDGMLSAVPFFNSRYDLCSPELRAAGARAHNRYVTEFCSIAPNRLLGVHLIYPWPDVDAAVEDCRKAAEAGARAIYPPQQAGVKDDVCPPLYDRSYDRLWAACQEYGLAVHIHAGWGHPQGHLRRIVENVKQKTASGNDSALTAALESTFVERRPLWQFMWGGVFDRFPKLKLCFVEVHCDWVPATLKYLDELAAKRPSQLSLAPSEYWARQCASGTSIMRHTDFNARYEVGVDKVMFGTDYPHMESSWPNTWDFIRTTLGTASEGEARQLLGDNAIEFYNLDRSALEAVAQRCGPLPQDLLGEHVVDPRIVDHFDKRSGLRKQANVRADELAELVTEDLDAIG